MQLIRPHINIFEWPAHQAKCQCHHTAKLHATQGIIAELAKMVDLNLAKLFTYCEDNKQKYVDGCQRCTTFDEK